MGTRKLFAVSIASALSFWACSQTVSSSSSDEFSWDYPYKQFFPEMGDIDDELEKEMYFNYTMLDLVYIYSHARGELADSYRVYLGKGSQKDDNEKNFCTKAFYDVCYMFNQMKDPFTQYFDPYVAQMVYSSVMETDNSIGIGAEAEFDSTRMALVVSQVYPGAPSEKAGLKVGDIVLEIDGLHITSKDNFETMCSGNIGSTINIVVQRGLETIPIAITLEEFKEPSVITYYKDSIPVIQIKQFAMTTPSDQGTYGEFVAALQKTEGAKSTIIDLRGNPGGETQQCNAISAEFLSLGDTIISDIETNVDSIRDGDGWKYFQVFDTTTYTASRDGLGKDRYYVLLADTSTASCAEVVLSSVTVNKKAPVVGQLSYGKAIGQGVIDTYAKGLALITAIQGYDRNWETYHDVGIVPDYVIDDPDAQVKKAVELAKQATELRTAGYGTTRLNHFSKVPAKNSERKIPTRWDLKLRFKRL
ncbi:S41 family peptidase [Fibrobacter sp.]|uniref:S41 family peptidase n=1 Tax=Fibrobacter sp. TaxID=35828 RepID=UPI00388DEAE2